MPSAHQPDRPSVATLLVLWPVIAAMWSAHLASAWRFGNA